MNTADAVTGYVSLAVSLATLGSLVLGALKTLREIRGNRDRIDEVHVLVNSRLTKVLEQLSVAEQENNTLRNAASKATQEDDDENGWPRP